MEEILKKANELGLMLRETELYKDYEKLSTALEADEDSKKLLDEYMLLLEEYHNKETSGDLIEVYEKENLREIQQQVSENELIPNYIEVKNRYINLLVEIQKAISSEEENNG